MKQFCVPIALMLLVACGGGTTPPNDPKNPIIPPTAVEVATPKATTAVGAELETYDERSQTEILATGGKASSLDGNLVTNVPANGLSDTYNSLDVQMFENTMPGGLGSAYKIMYDATKQTQAFDVEVRLTDEQLEGTAPQDVVLAYQATNGRWQLLDNVTFAVADIVAPANNAPVNNALGTGSQTLAAPQKAYTFKSKLSKPAQVAAAAKYKLYPKTVGVKVANFANFAVLALTPSNDTPDSVGSKPANANAVVVKSWTVNGAAGVSGAVGSISENGPGKAMYTAPSKKPSPNTVVVTAVVDAGGRDVVLKSSVRIEDSKGWVDVLGTAQIHKSRTSASGYTELRGEVIVDAKNEVTEFASIPDVATNPQSMYHTLESKGGTTYAKITYKSFYTEDCVCSAGTYTKKVTYEFLGGGDIPTKPPMNAYAVARIQPSGQYELEFTPPTVVIPGKYSYSSIERDQCSDQNPPDEIITDRAGDVRVAMYDTAEKTVTGQIDRSKNTAFRGVASPKFEITTPHLSLKWKNRFAMPYYLPYTVPEPLPNIPGFPRMQGQEMQLPGLDVLDDLFPSKRREIVPQC